MKKRLAIDIRYLHMDYKGGIRTFTDGIEEGLVKNNCETFLIVWREDEKYWQRQYPKSKIISIERSAIKETVFKLLVILSWSIADDNLVGELGARIYKSEMDKLSGSYLDGVITTTTYNRIFTNKLKKITCLHDVQELYFPKNFSFLQRVWRNVMARSTVRTSDKIQVSSRYMQDCLLEKLPIERNNIVLIPEGVSKDRLEYNRINDDNYECLLKDVGKDYVFYPAGLWPHKNHEALLKALNRIKQERGEEIPCVLVGYCNGKREHLERKISYYQLEKTLYLGQVSNEELCFLYDRCKVVLAIGTHESSSLPAKEALALGKEVVCSNIQPNMELQEKFNLHMCDDSSESISCAIYQAYQTHSAHSDGLDSFHWENIVKYYVDEF